MRRKIFYGCCTKHQRSRFKWDLTSCDLLCYLFFPFPTTANHKKSKTQFSNPISTADVFHEFKTVFLDFHFVGTFAKEKNRKIQLQTSQKNDLDVRRSIKLPTRFALKNVAAFADSLISFFFAFAAKRQCKVAWSFTATQTFQIKKPILKKSNKNILSFMQTDD